MDTFLTQLLLVGVIFSQLLVYWQVKELAPKKRKYKHTDKYLTRKYLTKFPFKK